MLRMKAFLYCIFVINVTQLVKCQEVDAFLLAGGFDDYFKMVQQPDNKDLKEMSVCLRFFYY